MEESSSGKEVLRGDNLKQRQPVPRRRRRQVLGRVRVVLGVAAPAPLRRDEEAALVAPRPGGGPRVGGQARRPPVDHRRRAFGALRRVVHGVEARLHGRGRRGCSEPRRERRDDERRDGPRGDRRRIGTGDPGPQRHEKSAARRRRRRAIPKPRRRVVALVEDVVEARLPQALVDVRSRRRKGLGVARAGRQAQVARPRPVWKSTCVGCTFKPTEIVCLCR